MSQQETVKSVGHLRGAEVQAFRKRHKLSQDELADLLGITVDGVKKWELNLRGLSEPLWRLLQLFDKRPELMREF